MFRAGDWERLRGRKPPKRRGRTDKKCKVCGCPIEGRRDYCAKYACAVERENREREARREYFRERGRRRAAAKAARRRRK